MDQGHHHQQLHHQYSSASADAAAGGDRFPQWSIQETRDFLMIRAELDPNFMETKRNKLLWEVISTRMKEKGYSRSAEQCKCKWKNLVTRYKGCETMETEAMRQQFPFYTELQTIFATRMQRMLWLEAEGSGSAATTSKKKAAAQFSSDEEDENEESEGEKAAPSKKKRKVKGGNTSSSNPNPNSNSVVAGIREMMEEFMKQQMQIEMQWMKAYEAREEERRIKEMEWRQTMEALENERMMMEKRWREREEQRKMREEARAEKRDALITALLNKLRREDNM
ncbi:Homeodomain-like superfamily protein [Perilla frutescens var. hirtella]|uniref:Homeodomain-like superfamily protein n=1 Tax=Perilla frutescens var. hirtella TaxID=608512 RepID=A0AAD4JR48_PERFH|nr:Homeodomain-like superfamily protein [Perilla frutescens var. frutescens]KAH6787087.1 Homeodomain-like superfamily protein [Perilla frutescens var. hirtella]KAH6837573.1 Homeodomain-like superfamily protein [Perilla frutescens var. hirtella]